MAVRSRQGLDEEGYPQNDAGRTQGQDLGQDLGQEELEKEEVAVVLDLVVVLETVAKVVDERGTTRKRATAGREVAMKAAEIKNARRTAAVDQRTKRTATANPEAAACPRIARREVRIVASTTTTVTVRVAVRARKKDLRRVATATQTRGKRQNPRIEIRVTVAADQMLIKQDRQTFGDLFTQDVTSLPEMDIEEGRS